MYSGVAINPRPSRRETEKIEKNLIDQEYINFFSHFTKDQLKSFHFFEDIPGLTPRNAFHIRKSGDKNNQCFDSVYFKELCLYDLNDEKGRKLKNESKAGRKKMTRKQLRQIQINSAIEKRYFSKQNIKSVVESSSVNQTRLASQKSTLSDKMWLYLEVNKLAKADEQVKKSEDDLTADFMKYLSENKNDVAKWLEFIDYQSTRRNIDNKEAQASPSALYERKKSIFERAIQENPNSFRLKVEMVKFKAQSVEHIDAYNAFEAIERDFYMLLSSESIKLNVKKINRPDLDEIILNLFEVWFELIKFSVNFNSSSVLFDQIKRQFIKCFAFFLKSSNVHLKRLWCGGDDCTASSHIYRNLILQLLDNYFSFLVRSGYVEKAVGLYQALIDFNLCVSSSNKYKNLDTKSRLTLFELFWDMGLPKFGEAHSTGWLNCLENRDEISKKIEAHSNETRPDDRMDPIENELLERREMRIEHRWLSIECLRSLVYWYPFYARVSYGETSDDCCDPDRLISFEDDLAPFMFDLSLANSDQTLANESLKFKLVLGLFKLLGLIVYDEASLDTTTSNRGARLAYANRLASEDDAFLNLVCNNCSFLSDPATRLDQIPFIDANSYLETVIRRLFDSNSSQLQRDLYLNTAQNFLAFVRNSLKQAYIFFNTLQFKTYLIILKWKFELMLYQLVIKYSSQTFKSEINPPLGFEPSRIKENLLNLSKTDLSLEANRSNFDLWREYSVLKLILNKGQTKETKKIFDTLLKTSESSQRSSDQACIDIYSLSIDYVLVELGMFHRPNDVESTHLVDKAQGSPITVYLSINSEFANLSNSNQSLKLKDSTQVASAKEALCNMLIQNCLNKTKAKLKSTFKIEMSGSTRLLLVKRDFQLEYDQLLQEAQSNSTSISARKLALFHQVYTFFLWTLNDIDRIIELNETIMTRELFGSNPNRSKMIEAYLTCLNYLYYRECKIDKFRYKTKLYEILKSTAMSNSTFIPRSLLDALRLTLIRFKLDSSTSALVNQIVESSDVDSMFARLAASPQHGVDFMIAHICAHLVRVERIVRDNFRLQQIEEFSATTLGVNHQIRRLFETYVRARPLAAHLWLFYFRFESSRLGSESPGSIELTSSARNRLLAIYYQSVQNLPYHKIFYLYATKYVPDQYNEIMNVLYTREMRTYLPIQELNMLLEPIQDPSEVRVESVNEEKKDESSGDETKNLSDMEISDQAVSEESKNQSDNDSIVDMSMSDGESASADEDVGLEDF